MMTTGVYSCHPSAVNFFAPINDGETPLLTHMEIVRRLNRMHAAIEAVIPRIERSGFGERADGLHEHAENALTLLRSAVRR